MALEIMLNEGKLFCHDLRHDLESVLYVIIWVCTHMTGVESERKDLNNLHIREWCGLEEGLTKLGFTKLAHLAAAKISILPQVTAYWDAMKPFIQELINKFFPLGPAEPNTIVPAQMLPILLQAKQAILQLELPAADCTPQDVNEVSPLNYATLSVGKRYRLGQEVAMVPKKRARCSEREVGAMLVWEDSVFS